MGRAQEDLVNDRRRVRNEYDEFKARINGLEPGADPGKKNRGAEG